MLHARWSKRYQSRDPAPLRQLRKRSVQQMDHNHVCPWSHRWMLTVAGRKLLNNPGRIVGPWLQPGMTAMDVGCGVGYFTVPMARIVGDTGRVIAVDVQPEMLTAMQSNADKAGCGNIVAHQCDFETLGVGEWAGAVDFAILFYMLHEPTDPARLVGEVCDTIKPGGKVLFAEPLVHVDGPQFRRNTELFTQAGLHQISAPRIPISRAVVLQKP